MNPLYCNLTLWILDIATSLPHKRRDYWWVSASYCIKLHCVKQTYLQNVERGGTGNGTLQVWGTSMNFFLIFLSWRYVNLALSHYLNLCGMKISHDRTYRWHEYLSGTYKKVKYFLLCPFIIFTKWLQKIKWLSLLGLIHFQVLRPLGRTSFIWPDVKL